MTKTVFVSGATSGIGLATAKKLHAAGWKVFAGGLQGDNFLQLGHEITQLPFDIGDEDGVSGAAKFLSIEIEQLDALVNNAGIQISGHLEALSMQEIRRQFDVNVFGHLHLIKALLPLLKKAPSARIVNVSSLMGEVAMPMLGAYSMSKHALEAMSDVLRLELAPQGIHVSVVAPGAISTPMAEQSLEKLEELYNNSFPEVQSDYKFLYEGMAKTLENQNQSATSPEKIAEVIVKALTTENPKARYSIGAANTGLSTIRKIAPKSFGDWFLKRALGIK